VNDIKWLCTWRESVERLKILENNIFYRESKTFQHWGVLSIPRYQQFLNCGKRSKRNHWEVSPENRRMTNLAILL
jgi:hypothetical protein